MFNAAMDHSVSPACTVCGTSAAAGVGKTSSAASAAGIQSLRKTFNGSISLSGR